MKRMKKLFLTVLSMSALMISACSGGGGEASSSEESSVPASSQQQSSSTPESSSEAPVVTVTLDITTAILEVGDTETLTATVSDGSAVTWASDDEEVVTVSGGVITAVGAGYARVTATSGTASASCSVRVDDADDPQEDPVRPAPQPSTAVGGIVIKKGETWTDPLSVNLYNNPDNANEVMATNVSLQAGQEFYIQFDSTSYRHHNDLKYGGASESFASEGEDKNFKVLEGGSYSFYIEREYDPAVGSVWVEGVKTAPVFDKYTVQFGSGDPIELEEIAVGEDQVGIVLKQYSATIPTLTAGEAIVFKGGTENIAPGDENESGKEHNGNNTIGDYPYFYVHNDAMNAKVYLKAYADGYSFWLAGYDSTAADPEVPENPKPIDEDAVYYLVGKIGGVEDWASVAYPFELNAAQKDAEEYQLKEKVELKAGDAIKVMSSNNAYYPDGMGTEINIAADGTFQIYFRPAGNSDWTQGGGYFFLYAEGGEEPEPGPEPVTDAAFYLKGSMNQWKEDDNYVLTQDGDNENKYFIKLDLAQGDKVKVYGKAGTGTWYPTEGVAYKQGDSEHPSALKSGYLAEDTDHNLSVVVPGYYFIEINVEAAGEGKDPGIWTSLESEEEALLLDDIEVNFDGASYTAATFRKDGEKWQYDVASETGHDSAKNDVVSFRWASESKLTLTLGEGADSYVTLNEDKASVKVKVDSAKLNYYLVLGDGTVTVYVAEVVAKQTIKASLGDYSADSAVVYVWAWKGSGDGAWYAYDSTAEGFKIPENCDHLKVVRFASGTETPSWEATIWNQTGNMEIQSGKTLTYKSWTEFEWK